MKLGDPDAVPVDKARVQRMLVTMKKMWAMQDRILEIIKVIDRENQACGDPLGEIDWAIMEGTVSQS